MEGQFLVRQIYDDEITYNLVGAAVEVLGKQQIATANSFHYTPCSTQWAQDMLLTELIKNALQL